MIADEWRSDIDTACEGGNEHGLASDRCRRDTVDVDAGPYIEAYFRGNSRVLERDGEEVIV